MPETSGKPAGTAKPHPAPTGRPRAGERVEPGAHRKGAALPGLGGAQRRQGRAHVAGDDQRRDVRGERKVKGASRSLLHTLDTFRPSSLARPVRRKPRNHVIVFLGGESLAVANSHEEPTVRSTKTTHRRLAEASCHTVALGERQEICRELSFHTALIVGFIPLFNRKHPISHRRGKFPILAS